MNIFFRVRWVNQTSNSNCEVGKLKRKRFRGDDSKEKDVGINLPKYFQNKFIKPCTFH